MKTDCVHYSWTDFQQDTTLLALKIALSGWRPDYIVGIVRGGAIPAVMLSHLLQVPVHMLKVSLRGAEPDTEDNCWMAEDALGYHTERKNILLVDDCNDSGDTLNWIQQNWEDLAAPHAQDWSTVWSHSVRVAVLHNNLGSAYDTVNYAAHEFHRADEPRWICYPWEV